MQIPNGTICWSADCLGQIQTPKKKSKANKVVVVRRKVAIRRPQVAKKKKMSTIDYVAQGAGVLGRVGGKFIRGALGLPFEVSGTTAIASPQSMGPIQVSAPQANGYIKTTGSAKSNSIAGGGTRVSHREYIMDVTPNETTQPGHFQLLLAADINPANSTLFPWLSALASRYEGYIFRALRFVYEPQCSTTTPGTVNIAVDYDASDDPPSSKLQMMSYKGAVRSPPWFCSAFTCDPKDFKSPEYYVKGSGSNGADSRLTNLGKIFVAYEGPVGDSVAAGELYVEYIVDLKTPNLEPFALSGILTLNGPGNTNVSPTNFNPIVSGPQKFNVAGSGNNFFIGVEKPGLYWLSVLTPTAIGTQLNLIDITIPSTSSASFFSGIDGPVTNVVLPLSINSASASAAGSMVWSGAVNFPSVSDVIQLAYTGGDWTGTGSKSISLNFAPWSQDTLNFPSASVSGVPGAFALALGQLAKLSLKDSSEPTKLSNKGMLFNFGKSPGPSNLRK
jgi:hypothetical protein